MNERFVTLGQSTRGRVLVISHQDTGEERIRIISARRATRKESDGYEKEVDPDELRDEYDFGELSVGVRGKYLGMASAGSNLVLLEPDVARAFPTAAAVNQALRMLVDLAEKATAESDDR